MSSFEEDELQPPVEFKFPFVPYDIQKDFMRNLYQAIERKKIGIFESPTGTGKSMSIICGALTWLEDHEKRIRSRLENILAAEKENTNPMPADGTRKPELQSAQEPDWITEFVQNQSVRDEKKQAKTMSEKLRLRDIKMKRILDGLECDATDEPRRKRMKYARTKGEAQDETTRLMEQARRALERHDKNLSGDKEIEDDQDIILEEYYSDDETDAKYLDLDEAEESEDNGIQKIFYSSRTHSQLTQFIREIQKSPFGIKTDEALTSTHISVVPLASRQSMCINEAVKRLSSMQQINDRCLDMQKSSKKKSEEDETSKKKKGHKSSAACPFLKSQGNVDHLSDKILGKIQDIEEIVKAGKTNEGCPYYATRNAVPMAQLVVVPYQILLHSSTRKASGIKLKDSVVIIDEAHNLVDTISNIHSFEVTCAQVLRAHNQLSQYAQKFSKRLKAKNLMYVKQILFVLSKLLAVMGATCPHSRSASEPEGGSRPSGSVTPTYANTGTKNEESKTSLMTIHDFLFKANMDNINLFKVLRYCERSMISRKLNGFVEKYDEYPKAEVSTLTQFLSNAKKAAETSSSAETNRPPMTMRSPLMHIESFLSSLTSTSEDGRVAVTTLKMSADTEVNPAKVREVASIKYLLLNPATHFKDVVDECRSLIVAGGTMQPSSSFVNQLLFPTGVPSSRIFEFSCGHVINKDQLLPIVLSNGPSGAELEFTFSKRNSQKLIDDLGRLVFNLCNVVPGGIVCFFPSYDYEKMVHAQWQQTGLLSKIGVKKKVFREPKRTGQVDGVLSEYSACIQRTKPGNTTLNGALLLSVVGGKMSEGINFSDDLGRCVVMVGLPYPNMYSAELKEKMVYLDTHMPKVGTRSAGQSYYENLCMKAVNQSIGRAIRHKSDHACIVLADKRYCRQNVKSQLPGWIADKTSTAKNFGQAFGEIRKFFISKKKTIS